MIVLGLTGSIGMGKSTVAAMFRRAGVPVYDADAEVHRLQGPGGALVAAIEAAFPGSLGGHGGIDRALLGRQVLGDGAAMRRLEALIHPVLRESRRSFLRRHRAAKIVVLDIPLLFEKGAHKIDASVVVSAPAWKQARRVLARPNMNPLKLRHIRGLQLADHLKRARADFVIDTGTTRDRTAAAVRHLIACLRARGVRYCRSCVKSSSTPKQPA